MPATIDEIDAAFATFARERPDALFVAARRILHQPRRATCDLGGARRDSGDLCDRDFVAAGGLMSYGTDLADMFHQVGVYTGSILKGAKPADLPVMQTTKFELVINRATAKALGLAMPAGVLSIADEVIE